MCKFSQDYIKSHNLTKVCVWGNKTFKDNETTKVEAINSCNQVIRPKNEPVELVENEDDRISSCFKKINWMLGKE